MQINGILDGKSKQSADFKQNKTEMTFSPRPRVAAGGCPRNIPHDIPSGIPPKRYLPGILLGYPLEVFSYPKSDEDKDIT